MNEDRKLVVLPQMRSQPVLSQELYERLDDLIECYIHEGLEYSTIIGALEIAKHNALQKMADTEEDD